MLHVIRQRRDTYVKIRMNASGILIKNNSAMQGQREFDAVLVHPCEFQLSAFQLEWKNLHVSLSFITLLHECTDRRESERLEGNNNKEPCVCVCVCVCVCS